MRNKNVKWFKERIITKEIIPCLQVEKERIRFYTEILKPDHHPIHPLTFSNKQKTD